MKLLIDQEEAQFFTLGLRQFVILTMVLLLVSLSLLFYLREKGTISFSPEEKDILCDYYQSQAEKMINEARIEYGLTISSNSNDVKEVNNIALILCRADMNECFCDY